MSDRIDFDGAWKETLELYLPPFTALCFPAIAQTIDWSVPVEYLDKELQKIMRNAALGKQYVDKLIKVRRRDGEPEYVLVHIEVQAQADLDLPRRMYRYHHRIVDRFGRRTASLAVLADSDPDWRPSAFEEELWGCRVRFEYPVCKLLDLEPELERWIAAGNPAAVVVSAHLATQATYGDMEQRKQRKWKLARGLYEQGYGREDVLEILRLIDWLMILNPKALEIEFQQQLTRYEGELRMPFVTSFERLAREEGLAKGLAEGRREEAINLLLRLARKRFPEFVPGDEEALRRLPIDRMGDLSEALLDFTGIDDLRQWLSRSAPSA